MSEPEDHRPEQNDDPMSVSRLPQEEELRFSAPAPEIEGYQIVDMLGEAGQGQVWRAVQRSTGRQVALKVPRIGLLSSKKTLARFEREVEIAAQLKHPHIARIIDSGVHRGLYYYAMDLIEGKHRDQYVKDNGLSQRQILELMRTICEAVQHAHQNGVIHRDLKPSNIIVTEAGHPYIVDFGLAKSLVESQVSVTVSVDGEAAGTPAFMSPEQAGGQADRVDTRTDVYSLGAILYALLTSRNPHDLSGSHYDVLHRIAEQEVTRPRKLDRRMDRDLESLLLKALERDPGRRYSSAAGLAEDIDHYLQGLPLSATPRSRMRRVESFVCRHRVGVAIGLLTSAMGLAAVIILAVSTILISIEKQRTQDALEREQQVRAESERQAKIAQAVADFLNNDLLASVDPATARGRRVTVREILDAASQRIEGGFRNEPLIEASVRQTLGNAYMELGEYARAERHLERAHLLYQEYFPEISSSLRTRRALGRLYVFQGRHKEAEAMLVQNLEISKRVLGEEQLDTLECMIELAALYKNQGRYQEAESLNLTTLEISKRVLGEEHPCTLESMAGVATLYGERGRYQEAEALYREMLEIGVRRLGEEHPDTLRSMSGLALQYKVQGRYQEAKTLYLKTVGVMQRVLGEEHPDTLRCTSNLAELYGLQGRHQEAESLLLKTREIRERVLGEEHPDTLHSMNSLALLYCQLGRYQEAESLHLKTVEVAKRVLGEKHPDTVDTLNLLIALYEVWGKPEEARKWRAQLPQEVAESTAAYGIPKENLTIPEELQVCVDHLKKIHAAIVKYMKENGTWPHRLSNLVPDYLDDDVLLCPKDLTHKTSYSPDPRLPCSYSWEFSPDPVPEGWDSTGRTQYRDWKRQQTEFFGDVVPMVRCTHHGDQKVLSLSVDGQVYLSPIDWEYMFKKDYRFGEERSIRLPQAAGGKPPLSRDLPSQPLVRADLPERRQIAAPGRKASWSPGGDRVVFGRPPDAGLRILDLETGQATDVTTSGTDPAWSPDGRLIAYVDRPNSDASQPEEVWLIKPTGDAHRKLVEGGHPSWSPDGKTLFVQSRREKVIFSLDVDSPDAEPRVFFDGSQSWYPAISPDGARIAYGKKDELVIVDRATHQIILTWPTPGRRGLLPAWSPDGRQIAFGGFDDDLFGVWVLDVNTHEVVRIVEGPYTMPVWSNDGMNLAFDLRSGGVREVWMVETKAIRGARIGAARAAELSRSLPNSHISPPDPSTTHPGEGLPIGKPAPGFVVQDVKGQLASLSDFKGKVVLLHFWTSGCPPCAAAIPCLEALHVKHKEEDLVVIGLNNEPNQAEAKFSSKSQISYRMLLDADRQFAEYGIKAVPTLVYIDKDGTVRHQQTGFGEGAEKEIETKVTALLGPGSHAGPDGEGGRTPRGRQATEPSPADRSDIGPSPNTKLRWTPAPDAVAHRVYFGPDPRSLVLLKEVGSGDAVESPQLERQHWYCWRVDAIRSDGSAVGGTLWSFSTGDLVAWWRLDEKTGRTVADGAGRGHHGTLVGNPQWEQGCIGGALAFDGINDYVSVEDSPDFDISAQITLACWINVTYFDKQWQAVIAKGNRAWRIIRANDRRSIEFACTGIHVANTIWGNVYGNTVVDDGKWHQIVGVYDGTHLYLYVDGTLDSSVDGTGTLNTNEDYVLIGANEGDTRPFWRGLIDDVRVYSYALSEEEVRELCAGIGPGVMGRPAWLVEMPGK